MPSRRLPLHIALACAAGLAVAGCSGSSNLLDSKNEGGWFSKPVDLFAKPDWARPSTANASLGPWGPVGPEDLVGADGSCAPAPAEAAAAPPAASAEPPPDRLQTDGGGAAPASAPQVMGCIALGMTECQAVRRAGQPGNVAISADEKGERKVVLTYLSGTWPGIYTFSSGRLKTIDMAHEQQKPKAAPKKKPAKRAKTAQPVTSVTVQ